MTTPPTPPVGPPVAPRVPFTHREHGVERPDPYHWLREADSPDVLGYLTDERGWYDTVTAHLDSLVATLRAEMVSRLPATHRSPAWRRTRFSYYTRYLPDREYAELMREIRTDSSLSGAVSVDSPAADDGSRTSTPGAECLLDFGSLADDSGYLDLGVTLVSPDENLLAYSFDTSGDEVYALRFRDLRTGEDLADTVPRSYYGGAWSSDSGWYFYTVHDAASRPCEVWRHRIGTDTADDVLVLTEPDERFGLNLRGSRSGELVVVWSESNTVSESWVIDAGDVTRGPWSVGGRRDGVLYRVDHRRLPDGSEDLVVVTNDDAVEFRLMTCPVPTGPGQDWTRWTEARPEGGAERLERADAFGPGVVLSYRAGGDHRLRVVGHDDLAGAGRELVSRFPSGEIRLARTPSYDVDAVTVLEEADVEPAVWSGLDLRTGTRTEVHRAEAPVHDPGRYLTERHVFPAPDGIPVPATVIRHRDTPLDGTAPGLVYGYGAYEAVFEPEWDPALPVLLDRGVVWVRAHIRGGGEGGRRWYLDGKMRHKQHTFDDQVAVADGLAAAGLVDPDRICSRGLSAGGLLQGAVFSQRPDRWRAVVAEVPFVDVVTTMFDEATPLTATEWEEWGDPRLREEFDWMLAYSPYENLPAAGARPDLLVTGAVHDPRVMVREPAKWVAALRHSDPEWSPRCLFRCEVGAGAHVGPSGRYAHLAYEAEVYAWLLDRLGMAGSGS